MHLFKQLGEVGGVAVSDGVGGVGHRFDLAGLEEVGGAAKAERACKGGC